MKIVFFGTPNYVLPVLSLLHHKFKGKNGKSPIVAIVTQSPKPTGRKKEFQFSAVDNWAHKKGIEKFFNPLTLLENSVDADLGVLASYGAFIPKEVISKFAYGILNIHPSPLPLWRGASPVQATIISETQAGASIIKINENLDAGPIITQFKDEVLTDDTTETLRNRLFERSAEILLTLIPSYLAGKVKSRSQDDSSATYTREVKRSDGFIPPEYLQAGFKGLPVKVKWKIGFMKDYSLFPDPYSLERFIRAMQPWPGAWTTVRIKNKELRIKILKSHLELKTKNETATTHQPQSTKHHLVLDEVQLEGKNPVSWKQFKEGYPEASLLLTPDIST